jgi:hypothetical protein
VRKTNPFLFFFIFFIIKVVRSSTNKLQDVYAQAKNKSAFIRLPCSLAETVADKSFKIAFTIANPLVKLSRGPGKLPLKIHF